MSWKLDQKIVGSKRHNQRPLQLGHRGPGRWGVTGEIWWFPMEWEEFGVFGAACWHSGQWRTRGCLRPGRSGRLVRDRPQPYSSRTTSCSIVPASSTTRLTIVATTAFHESTYDRIVTVTKYGSRNRKPAVRLKFGRWGTESQPQLVKLGCMTSADRAGQAPWPQHMQVSLQIRAISEALQESTQLKNTQAGKAGCNLTGGAESEVEKVASRTPHPRLGNASHEPASSKAEVNQQRTAPGSDAARAHTTRGDLQWPFIYSREGVVMRMRRDLLSLTDPSQRC